MKKIFFIISAVLVMTGAVSCGNSGNGSAKNEKSEQSGQSADKSGTQQEYVHQIPAEERTPEQQKMVETLEAILKENIKVIDGKAVFGMSESEFMKTGLEKKYYDRILQDIKDINSFVKKNELNADSLFTDWK